MEKQEKQKIMKRIVFIFVISVISLFLIPRVLAQCDCPGDVSGDGQVDLEDLQRMADMLLDVGTPFVVINFNNDCADLNNDNQINLEDLQALVGILLDVGSPFVAECKEEINITRSINNVNSDIYEVNLHVDFNENTKINASIIQEYYPVGWEVVEVNGDGVYENQRRLDKNLIEWLFDKDGEFGLLVEDTTLSYTIRKVGEENLFSGGWITSSNEGVIRGDNRA